MIAAVVLAAGRSSRMGSPKALLPDRDGSPFIVRLVRTLGAAGLSPVLIVTNNASHHEIDQVLSMHPDLPSTRLMRNMDPDRGQLSSIWTALDALPPEAEAMLMTLVDAPFVAPATVRAIVEDYQRTRAPIVRPAAGDRHGHPVIFDRALFPELRTASLDTGGKSVVRAHAHQIRNVPVVDPGAFEDIDSPQDYERYMGTAR